MPPVAMSTTRWLVLSGTLFIAASVYVFSDPNDSNMVLSSFGNSKATLKTTKSVSLAAAPMGTRRVEVPGFNKRMPKEFDKNRTMKAQGTQPPIVNPDKGESQQKTVTTSPPSVPSVPPANIFQKAINYGVDAIGRVHKHVVGGNLEAMPAVLFQNEKKSKISFAAAITGATGNMHRSYQSGPLPMPEALAAMGSEGNDPRMGPLLNPPLMTPGRGYGKTYPLFEPQRLATDLKLHPELHIKASDYGTSSYNTFKRLLATYPQRVIRLSPQDRMRVSAALPGIDGSACRDLNYTALIMEAESAANTFVESRIFACMILKSALGSVIGPEFLQDLGFEKVFGTVEARFFTRDLSRFSVAASDSYCKRHWGAEGAYLGAGVYGLAYIRCSDNGGHCAEGNRAVMKIAGLPPWDYVRRKHPGRLPPWGTQKDLVLSKKSLTLGYDSSPESFYTELLRTLVANQITPNIAIGYATWMCDDFLHTHSQNGGLLPDRLVCNAPPKKSLSAEERKKACTNVLDEIRGGDMGPNMQVLAQEEVEYSLEDTWAQIYNTMHTTNPTGWLLANKALFFELIYTVAAIQHHVPGFRHNDFSWYNIRTTAPDSLDWKLKGIGPGAQGLEVPGSMAVPMKPDGRNPATHLTYSVNDTTFTIPNFGYHIRIADFDFAHTEGSIRMRNPKVTKLVNHTCGKELRTDEIFGHPIVATKETLTYFQPLSKSNPQWQDHQAKSCKDWKDCREFDPSESSYAAEDWDSIVNACPDECGSPARYEITVPAPNLPKFVTDNAGFKDERDYNCHEWEHDPKGCLSAKHSYRYSEKGFNDILRECPKACSATTAVEKDYMIRIEGSPNVVDGEYSATVISRDARFWLLRIDLNTTWGKTRVRTGAPVSNPGSLSRTTVFFNKGPYFKVYSLMKFNRKDGNIKYTAVLDGINKRPYISPLDLLMIFDNDATTGNLFRVKSVPRKSTTSGWIREDKCKGKPCSIPPNPANIIFVELDSTRTISPGMREEASHTHVGGFGYVSGKKATEEFEDYAKYGITTAENTRFDMHFMLNLLRDHILRYSQAKHIHSDAKKFVLRMFENSGNPKLATGDSTNTYDYRVSTNMDHWICDRKGKIATDDPVIKGFPSPMEMLRNPFFDDLRQLPVDGSIEIGHFNMNNHLPPNLHVGTGELP